MFDQENREKTELKQIIESWKNSNKNGSGAKIIFSRFETTILAFMCYFIRDNIN